MTHKLLSTALLFATLPLAAADSLQETFRNPPTQTRPYVWWHWLGSNFSKEGITKDLEAMKASGIGGATIFNITSSVMESHSPTLNNPWPDQTYRSPKYWEAMKHAAAEAQRLGLEIGLHNTVGYSTTGGPWIDEPRSMQRVVTTTATVNGGAAVELKLPEPQPKADEGWGRTGRKISWFKDFAVLAVPADKSPIAPDEILDLTDKTDPNGVLRWTPPAGKWTVMRLAHASTGRPPHPVPDDLLGKVLEVDKMSLEQNRFHWDEVIEPMKQHLGPYLGKSFKHFLIDSFEAGSQNWTPEFRNEFRKRKGYDPLPWLPTLEKKIIGSEDQTARFKWDYEDVIRTLFLENGWIPGAEKIKAVGMDLQFEPYGGQFDTTDGVSLADLPMGEFWTSGGGGIGGNITASARAAGRRIVGAEGFTGPPELSKWSETPAYLKRSADGSFASGVNRLVLHHWVHQPFDDRYKPGFGMGWWGTHFNRHQTWAKDGTAFFKYLGRCQALLQAGEAPADFVSVGKAQGGDLISWRMFRAGLSVKDGSIVLPSGRSYRFLSIPHDGLMTPRDLDLVRGLLEDGATIVCPKPSGAPGLSGYPQSNDIVRNSTLWNGSGVIRVGKGKLHSTSDISGAVKECGITPWIDLGKARGISATARITGSDAIFFVANTTPLENQATLSLRIQGKTPELWNAEDGSIRPAPVWREKDGRTEVDLTLGGLRSIFIVFRERSARPADHLTSIRIQGASSNLEILSARFGAADGNRWMDVTESLRSKAATGALEIPDISPSAFGRDPAPNVVKTLEIAYRFNGKENRTSIAEGKPLTIGSSSGNPLRVHATDGSAVTLASATPVQAELTFASGSRKSITTPQAPAASQLRGPWRVVLDSPVEPRRELTLPQLASLSENPDASIRYFSGTATYSSTFEIPATPHPVELDLGKVHDLARVTVNGRDLGVIWQAPFRIDITPALKPGRNELKIAVTNTWHNRLVGDEQHEPDFEWGGDRGSKGRSIKGYPDWFVKNLPRPSKDRKCFVVWYYHRKDTPLLPSGLVGPVTLVPHVLTTVRP